MRGIKNASIGLVVTAILSATGAAAAEPATPVAGSRPVEAGRVVLTERSYWRCYYRWAPARISPSALAAAGVDVTRTHLAKPFYYPYPYSHQGHGSPVTFFVSASEVSVAWQDPDYDDRAWPRHRLPLGTGRTRTWAERCHGLGTAYLRGRFHVADPEAVEAVTLDVTYRGGVAIYLNGQEVARGHVPAGPLAADTPAADYPVDAYGAEVEDAGGRSRRLVLPDLPVTYRPIIIVRGRRLRLPRNVWERVRRLRDRRLKSVVLSPRLLRRGENVLAVEVHRSDYQAGLVGVRGAARPWPWRFGEDWLHGHLLDLRLSATPAGAVEPERRPRGVTLWGSDIHRRWYSPEFGEAGREPGVVRLVGARNGVYSGQVVLSTDRDLLGLAASVSNLMATGGRQIPASAVQVRFGVAHAIAELAGLGTRRGSLRSRRPKSSREIGLALARHAPATGTAAAAAGRLLDDVKFFDHLSPSPPPVVAAHSCQPVWITLRIPPGTPAGTYRGTFTIRPGDDPALSVPVEVEVVGWTLPPPRDFRTIAAIETSPYGVAAAYDAPLWSDRHLALVRRSLEQVADLGGDLLIVPVLTRSEFGNETDSMVRFRRGPRGQWTCDLAVLERYLDAAVPAIGKPRMVCFVVNHAVANNRSVDPHVVSVKPDGRLEEVAVPAPGTPEAARLWGAFVAALKPVMERRGILDAVCWGFPWDILDGRFQAMKRFLGARLPAAGWVRGCHQSTPDATFRCTMSIYSLPPPLAETPEGNLRLISRRGWKERTLHLVLPRVINTVITVDGTSPPFAYRLLPERAIVAGARGFGRVGADYWADTYQRGWTGGARVGMPVMSILWPGKDGPEGSARFEALREGLQEAEARIALEQALDGGRIRSPQQADRIRALLEKRMRTTLVVPAGANAPRITEYTFGWQQRSRDLYRAVADVAAASP